MDQAPPTLHAAPPQSEAGGRGFQFKVQREWGLLLLFLGMMAYFISSAEGFGSLRNFVNALQYNAPLGVLAAGMTLVILTGGIDLSIGSMTALSAVTMGVTWKATRSPAAALAAGMAAGVAAGALNGLLITRGRIPALIVTLATLSVFRGLAYMIGGPETYGQFAPAMRSIGRDLFLGVPAPVWITLLLMGGAWIYLWRTAGGRAIYALGANAAAARLSGVPVNAMLLRLYMLNGAMSGLAAIIHAGLYDSLRADIGREQELSVITMVVLGGASVSGGEGGIAGSLLGFLTLIFIRRGMELQGRPSEVNGIVVAVLLISALLLDAGLRETILRRFRRRPAIKAGQV